MQFSAKLLQSSVSHDPSDSIKNNLTIFSISNDALWFFINFFVHYGTPKGKMGGKNIFQCFLLQLYHWVIMLYINCGHQGAVINMRGTEITFECALTFYFHFRDSRAHVLCVIYRAAVTFLLTTHFPRLDVCQWCSGSANHLPSSYQSSLLTLFMFLSEILTVMSL